MTDSVVPLSLNSRGPDVRGLHDALRRLGYAIVQHELDEQVFGVGTQHALLSFQTKRHLRRTGVLDEKTKTALAKAAAGAEFAQSRVEGRIRFEYGLPAGNLRLRLYRREFAGKSTLITEVTTDDHGFYLFSYDVGPEAANIEVRAVSAQGAEIALCAVKFNAERHEVLNLVAPASLRPLAPEYDRLAADLTAHLDSLKKLVDLRENRERHDLTLLHQAVGWDARLIALAALAVKRSAVTGLSHGVLYALFRSGLPTDPEKLARVSSKAIEKALRTAHRAGIVSLDDKEIAAAKTAFDKFARKARRDAKAPGALSSLHELLAGWGLTEADESTLTDLYFSYRGEPTELWRRAREAGISELKITDLRLLGKLGYLTFNNAVLAESLRKEIVSLDDLPHLVDRDLHRAETWKTRLRQLAENGDGDVNRLVPPAYGGDTDNDRLNAYSEDLARKVRVSFPTHVVKRMIETDAFRLGAQHSALKANVSAFLDNASGLGFELGRGPVNAFIRKHRSQLFPNETPDVAATIETVKTLTRLYQTTPTDDAMKAAHGIGFTSAHDIAAWPYNRFLDRFGSRFRTVEEAKLTYRKAQQISAVTYNVVTMAKLMDTAPRVYALFPPPQSPEEQPRNESRERIIRHFPALESFLGSIDFCECEHCRSVLSPAAYFVDLLQFLRTNGQNTHYDTLVERRPDLPHLLLTCENTNTTLPYIDLANEILEYQVAYGRLGQDVAYDTGNATTPELLGEPQHVLPAAYDRLVDARYPLALPFDLWLETVRRFLDHFKTPLWQVLEGLRPTSRLFAQPDVVLYDGAAVLAEYLGLSPAEYRLFTATDPASWYDLFGFASRDDATRVATDAQSGLRIDLNSAKTLARRLGVSYAEIIRVVRTAFVTSGPGRIRFISPEEDRCDFNETVLQDADGNSLGDLDFLKINLFVRLWKRLGWTIEETDRALQAFLPSGTLPLTAGNIGDAFRTALVYLAHFKSLSERVGLGKSGNLDLLNLWSNPPLAEPERVAALAKALKLAIPEFEVLKELSGLNPLTPIAASPLADLDGDHLHRYAVRFAEVAETVQRSGFTIEDLDYLLRHQFDPVGRYRSESDTQFALIRTLAADLRRLQAEHAIPANAAEAAALTDDLLQHKLALLLDPEVVETFMGMWTATLEYPAAQAFFERYLEIHSIDDDTEVGFLGANDFDLLVGPRNAEKRFRLATALMRFLQDSLGRQLIAKSLASHLGADQPLVDALLNRTSLLTQSGYPNTPLVGAFAAAAERGVTVTFFGSDDLSLDPIAPPLTVMDVDTEVSNPVTGGAVKPPGTRSARFEGYFDVPAAGTYRFFLVLDGADAEGDLQLADLPGFTLRGTANAGPVDEVAPDLKAGVPYRFTFEARQLGNATARLLIEGENLPKDGLARLGLYPAPTIGRARDACVLLAKSIRLIQGLGLSEREVRYLLTHKADFNDVDLGKLPTSAGGVTSEEATALFNQFLRLADYARLKRTLAAKSDDLIAIFEADPLAAKYERIAEVTRRDEQIVREAAEQLGLEASDLVDERGLWQLWDALQIVGKLNVSVQDAIALTGIAGRENTPAEKERKRAIVSNLKDLIKARFEPDDWRRLARTVFDKLRQHKRDALVAHVLHNHPERFENADELFEYFLIDPGMEPVVQTSRIRLAISSVQQFIQRCLLDLEPNVQPSAINSRHWQWMKRYRVWEANRKIFLYPENWLEPEFRDDKTHLFQELEGALLQGDVSNELAEDAFFAYLKGLERIAQLDIVAMYCEERADPASNIFHVIGRTPNKPHKYFYRRYANRMWTPWEPVTAEIEGDHIVAVVWHERLHLFWLTFLEKGTESAEADTTFRDLADESVSAGAQGEVAVQLNWSEYFRGQWTPRESAGFDNSIPVPSGGDFDPKLVVVHASTESDGDTKATVVIHFRLTIRFERPESVEDVRLSPRSFRLLSKNYPPKFDAGERPPTSPYLVSGEGATDYVGAGDLTIASTGVDILQEGHPFRLLFGGGQSERATLGRRFFYQDDQNTFFVEPMPPLVTLPEFEDLGIPDVRPDPGLEVDDRWNIVPMEPEVPGIEPEFVVDPDDPRWVDPLSTFAVHFANDWVTDPATVLYFDEGVIAEAGGQAFAIVPEADAEDEAHSRVEVAPGSALPAGSALIAIPGRGSTPRLGMNVVGGGGLTSGLMRNVLRSRGVEAFGQ